jgi:hypothetical protein
MRYQISDQPQERLDQINEWFTQILCTDSYFEDDKWLAIRLNLSKWKEQGFHYRQEFNSTSNCLADEEQALLFKIYNYLGEIMLMEAKMKEAAYRQKFDLAILYQDLKALAKQELKKLNEERFFFISFFRIENNSIVLMHIENYFINQDVKERLRK